MKVFFRWHVLLAALLLIVILYLTLFSSQLPEKRRFTRPVASLFPPPPAGWAFTPKPIADTPEMRSAINNILHFDDVGYAEYTKGDDYLSLYIAYWEPGKMPHRLVAEHTPDVCWVACGWSKTQSSSPQSLSLNGQFYPATEVRTYSSKNTNAYVYYWHLVGGIPFTYANHSAPTWEAIFSDIAVMGLRQKKEQFFIRIAASRPMESSQLAPIYECILQRLFHTDALFFTKP